MFFYNAATATKRAPMAPAKEPDRTLAALVETTTELVEVLEPDFVAVVRLEVPAGTVLLLPETPVADEVEPVAVVEALTPLPAPSEGESPEPEDATAPELAAETTDDAADVAEPDDAEVEDEPAAEVEEETSLQDKSKRGVVE